MIREKIRITVFMENIHGWTHGNQFHKELIVETDGSYDMVSNEVNRIVAKDFHNFVVINAFWQYV